MPISYWYWHYKIGQLNGDIQILSAPKNLRLVFFYKRKMQSFQLKIRSKKKSIDLFIYSSIYLKNIVAKN